MTLKNAVGLTLVGTFYDAGTQARRCYKPIRLSCLKCPLGHNSVAGAV